MNCVYSGGFDLIVSDQVWNDGVKTLINSGNHANMHSVTIIIHRISLLGSCVDANTVTQVGVPTLNNDWFYKLWIPYVFQQFTIKIMQ